MKIMILSAATGGGHIRAAQAIEQYIRENTDYDVENVDALKAVGKFLDKTVCDSYLFMAKRVPALFGRLYKGTDKDNIFAGLAPKLSGVFSSMLYKTVADYDPDVIITTHPFATEMVSSLKEDGLVTAPLICIITDYGAHRAYVAPMVNAYVTASEDMIPQLVSYGVEEEKIYPFGIPVNGAFFHKQDKEQTRAELGLKPDLTTILFMAGSFGVSNIIGMIRDLEDSSEKMQIVVITGKNQRLYRALERELADFKLPNKLVYFTDEVEKYMYAADLLITKPGGLTVSEALACGLPMAVFDAIPGQEEENTEFLLDHGMCIKLDRDGDFSKEISELLREQDRLKEMRENCESFDKSQSVPNLLKLITKLLEEEKVD